MFIKDKKIEDNNKFEKKKDHGTAEKLYEKFDKLLKYPVMFFALCIMAGLAMVSSFPIESYFLIFTSTIIIIFLTVIITCWKRLLNSHSTREVQ